MERPKGHVTPPFPLSLGSGGTDQPPEIVEDIYDEAAPLPPSYQVATSRIESYYDEDDADESFGENDYAYIDERSPYIEAINSYRTGVNKAAHQVEGPSTVLLSDGVRGGVTREMSAGQNSRCEQLPQGHSPPHPNVNSSRGRTQSDSGQTDLQSNTSRTLSRTMSCPKSRPASPPMALTHNPLFDRCPEQRPTLAVVADVVSPSPQLSKKSSPQRDFTTPPPLSLPSRDMVTSPKMTPTSPRLIRAESPLTRFVEKLDSLSSTGSTISADSSGGASTLISGDVTRNSDAGESQASYGDYTMANDSQKQLACFQTQPRLRLPERATYPYVTSPYCIDVIRPYAPRDVTPFYVSPPAYVTQNVFMDNMNEQIRQMQEAMRHMQTQMTEQMNRAFPRSCTAQAPQMAPMPAFPVMATMNRKPAIRNEEESPAQGTLRSGSSMAVPIRIERLPSTSGKVRANSISSESSHSGHKSGVGNETPTQPTPMVIITHPQSPVSGGSRTATMPRGHVRSNSMPRPEQSKAQVIESPKTTARVMVGSPGGQSSPLIGRTMSTGDVLSPKNVVTSEQNPRISQQSTRTSPSGPALSHNTVSSPNTQGHPVKQNPASSHGRYGPAAAPIPPLPPPPPVDADPVGQCIIEEANGKKELQMQFDMHDFKPEEIQVRNDKNKLEVHAHHAESAPDHTSCRVFHQQYDLPKDVRLTKLNSEVTPDGYLTIRSAVKPRHRVKFAPEEAGSQGQGHDGHDVRGQGHDSHGQGHDGHGQGHDAHVKVSHKTGQQSQGHGRTGQAHGHASQERGHSSQGHRHNSEDLATHSSTGGSHTPQIPSTQSHTIQSQRHTHQDPGHTHSLDRGHPQTPQTNNNTLKIDKNNPSPQLKQANGHSRSYKDKNRLEVPDRHHSRQQKRH